MLEDNNSSNETSLETRYPACHTLVFRWSGDDEKYWAKHRELLRIVTDKGFEITDTINAKFDRTFHNSMKVTTTWFQYMSGIYIEWPIYEAIERIFDDETLEIIRPSIFGY